MLQNLLEKLQLHEEKNLLIQGLPSSIEKQFAKLAFAKNVTPLLKTRKIDFALVFAVNENQLNTILREVMPALQTDGKFWIAHPKSTSKIATNLCRNCSWDELRNAGFESVKEVALDHVWTAVRYARKQTTPQLSNASVNLDGVLDALVEDVEITPPADFAKHLRRSKIAAHFFDTLSFTHKQEYVSWITGAKREETRSRRLELAIDKLIAGKKHPGEK
ncbi:MAG TPA: YdeI/OmpD-associated family protein [Flavitalea sp.]|nr:YdeI/OmpD-associated family protein [Flavitalea sp.]